MKFLKKFPESNILYAPKVWEVVAESHIVLPQAQIQDPNRFLKISGNLTFRPMAWARPGEVG